MMAGSRQRAVRGIGTIAVAGALALATAAQAADGPAPVRDGAHDFDFNVGTWHSRIRRLERGTDGVPRWIELAGRVVVRPIWNGRAFVEEVDAHGDGGERFRGMTLFLYDPSAHQWSLEFANLDRGRLGTPAIGGFDGGRGEFHDQEVVDGRTVLVRIVWSDIRPDAHRFEQSLSDDGGRTWQPNFVADVTRDAA